MRKNAWKFVIFAVLISVFALSAASPESPKELSERNAENIKKLSRGMSMGEAMRIMHSMPKAKTESLGEAIGGAVEKTIGGAVKTVGSVFLGAPKKVKNPYKTTIFKADRKTFEIMHYYTGPAGANGVIADNDLTPLVFENDTLIGWGREFFRKNRTKYEYELE